MSSDANMRSYSFKKLSGFRMTNADKQWYNESPGNLAFFHDTEIWTDAIPTTPPGASTAAVQVYNTLTLTADVTVADNKSWLAKDGATQLRGFIPPRFGSSYFVAVYDNNDDEIVTSDASVWTFDYDNGVLWFEGDPTDEGWSTPIKLKAYRYIGTVLNSSTVAATLQSVTNSGSYTNHGIQIDASGSYMYNLGITSGSLEMFNHKIIHLATPTADYDAATKKYVDDNGGASTDTLDDVVERGNYTDNFISIDASGSMFYNLGITSGSIDMFSNQKIIHLPTPTADYDAANKLYVDTVSGSIGDDLNNQIHLTRQYVDTVSGSIGTDIAANYAFKDATFISPLTTKGDVHTYSTADARLGVGTNDYVLTADSGEVTGLKWSTIDHGALTGLADDDHTQYSLVDGTRDYSGTLQISGSLSVDGSIRTNANNIYMNFDGGEGDVYWYVYQGGAVDGAYLKWVDAAVKFEFSEDLTVQGYTSMSGNCIVGGNLNVNNDGPEGDSQVSFYEGGSNTGAYLKWDDDPGTFVLNKTLSMNSTKITSVADPTDLQDVVTLNHLSGVVSGSTVSPLTTKGDIHTYSTENTRLPVGTDDYVLVADSGESTGLKWSAAAGATPPLQDVTNEGSYTNHGIQIDASGSFFYNLGITSGSIDMFGNNKIIHLGTPTADGDVANKLYVDTVSGSIGDDLNNQVLNLYEYVDTVSGSCAQSLQGVTNVGDTTTDVITATGFLSTGDNGTADTAYTPMVLYNTDATPPAASGFPIGTIYIQYTA